MSTFKRPHRHLTEVDVARHAELLKNRLVKRQKQIAPRFRRNRIEAYRLYDWDIPEVRARVDWYAGHLVAADYARQQTDEIPNYLDKIIGPAAKALGVDEDKVHLKHRETGAPGQRYQRLATQQERMEVREGELRFLVNLDDYIDTGLFPDHRRTRAMVRDESQGRAVLNLFGYTGAFTCYAAAGGAQRTTTVDLSGKYLNWARDNLELNGLMNRNHELVRDNVMGFLAHTRQRWDLAIVDPPSFSSEGAEDDFNVLRDHRNLVQDVLRVMTPGGRIYFSTNHQRFEPDLVGLGVKNVEEITDDTVPEDFRNLQVHRCFVIEV